MGRRILISGVTLAVAAAAAIVVAVTAGGDDDEGSADQRSVPGEPAVEVISPRDGSRHEGGAVVVKVKIHNFHLAPHHLGEAPELGEGFIRFSLNKVPEDLPESSLEKAESNPTGAGRAVGRPFDFPRYSGPNGTLAVALGSQGSYSPATVPEIYYRNLPTGFYRLIITLAQNNGIPTSFHGVTHFRIE
jgi:hypothetical protein